MAFMLKLLYMQPNQPQNQQPVQPQPVSTDYLDEIATPEVKSEKFSLKKILIFGGLALVIVLTLLFVLSSVVGKGLSSTERLAGKLYATNNVVEYTIKKKVIKNNKLRALNSTLALTLKDIIRDTNDGFLAKGIKFEKMKENKKILAIENSQEIDEILEEARLNGNFDQTYVIEMTHSLISLKILMEKVSNGNTTVSMRSGLLQGIENLTPIIEQFEEFGAATRTSL